MFRRAGTISLVALSLFLFCGDTAPVACKETNIGPSKGEVIGVGVAVVAVVVGTVVLIEVNKGHKVKGCVFTGPNGLQVQTTNDMKVYTLAGDTQNIKVGDLVQVHGSKVKKVKDSTGDQTFKVEKLSKDYGPCKVPPSASAPAAAHS